MSSADDGTGASATAWHRLGVVGLAITIAAIALVAAGLTVVPWFSFHDPSASFNGRDFANDHSIGGFASAYFQWVGWAALVVVATLTLLACCPIPPGTRYALRLTAACLAIVDFLGTAFALINIKPDDMTSDLFWKGLSLGPFICGGGVALLFVAALAAEVGTAYG